MMRNNQKIILAAGLLASALPMSARQKKTQEQPNLLFIITDQQRHDALGAVGRYPFLQTPNLDHFIKESAWFTRAYTPCAVSGPARSCILTGQLVEHTHVYTNELTAQDPVKNGFTTAPTFDAILADNGYYSEYHGKWHAPIGWTDCYEHFTWKNSNKNNPFAYRIGHLTKYMDYIRGKYGNLPLVKGDFMDNSMYHVPYSPDPIDRRALRGHDENGKLLPEELAKRIHTQPDNHGHLLIDDDDSFTAFQCREAIDAMRRASAQDKPFNITLSINYPHAPMLPTETYYNLYAVGDMPVPVSINDPMIDSPYKNENGRLQLPEYSDPNLIKYMMKNYFGLVSEIDNWLGHVFKELDKLGLKDNTIVIFMSDHGEMLGSHGMREKNVFYEESARVPFIIRYPGKIKPGVHDDFISTVDAFATIMDYTGVSDDRRDGKSLRPIIEGKKHSDFTVTEWLYRGIKQPSHMIVTKEWKLFFNYSKDSKVVPVLFNLKTDPYEMNNLLGKSNPDRDCYVEIAENLKQMMMEWLRERNSSYVEQIGEVRF